MGLSRPCLPYLILKRHEQLIFGKNEENEGIGTSVLLET